MGSNYLLARERMVDCQVRTADVTNPQVIQAFLDVPREEFVSAAQKPLAYVDCHLPVDSRMLLSPAALAKLLQAAGIGKSDVVLDIGCGTGYSTAIISGLCQFVVGLESDRDLAQAATENLSSLECDNAVVVEGPLTEGYAPEGPYDVIFLGGSVEELPEALLGQLKVGGRLLAVMGSGNSAMANLWVNDDGNISARPMFNCAIPPLAGFSKKPAFVF